MNKTLWWKIILAIVLPITLAAWLIYPPGKTLKPGIDLAGGTSMIYEIDTTGMDAVDQRELSMRMITVLRRRIDPDNMQNLVWRPQGNTRFEIQMPLTSKETREKRSAYQDSLGQLIGKNIPPAVILRSLKRPVPERQADFQRLAQNDPNHAAILENLARVYDERKGLQDKADQLAAAKAQMEGRIAQAGLSADAVKASVVEWSKQDPNKLTESVKAFAGSQGDPNVLIAYVDTFRQWASVEDLLTDEVVGKTTQYKQARRQLDRFTLTKEQIEAVLEMPKDSKERAAQLARLEAAFPDRADLLKKTVIAFDAYRPDRGRLDDATDLQRMLKGAGVLEFRILPATSSAQLSADEIRVYQEALSTKGPRYASDTKYVWCQIENDDEFRKTRGAILGEFGKKHYVLASNLPNECMLHSGSQRLWKLARANATQDNMGRRAIGFSLDERGAVLFANITGRNIDRPLCILLDGVAISAPNINDRIYAQGIIQGTFTETQVTDMVSKLSAGSLPARLVEQPVSIKTIGPSVGAENLRRNLRAGYIGVLLVIVGMILYYLKAGAIAIVAMLMNLLVTLAILAMLQATFTLSGIAGLILTVGMSVDANVLIYERIREEQAKGSGLGIAIKNGYTRAFSTIFDSNLTTMIPAAILYLIASEEIKGFAIVLMLGLALNLFTGVYVTRVIFDWLLAKGLIKDHLTMMHLIRVPKIDWMGLRPVFFAMSGLAIVGGLLVFFTRDQVKNNKYDIEFTGGMSVQLNFKEDVTLTRQDVQDRLRKAAEGVSQALAAANVYSVGTTGHQYEITTTETNKTRVTVTFPEGQPAPTVQTVKQQVETTQAKAGNRLGNLVVKEGSTSNSFSVTTTQGNTLLVQSLLTEAFPNATISKPVVEEVVKGVVEAAFARELAIQHNLEPQILSATQVTDALLETHPVAAEFMGGLVIECKINQPVRLQEIDQRIGDLLFKPDMQQLGWCTYKLLGPGLTEADANQPVTGFAYCTAPPEAGLRQFSEEEWTQYVDNEKTRVLTAASLETSLPRVTQIDPSVGGEAKTRALIAIVLSMVAMMAYIWVRFGNLQYAWGAVITLMHDVCVMLGVVAACTYVARTSIGQALLIGDFKFDLTMIAAFLTLVGYSLNDTIVVYDRIRENRQKAQMTPLTINASINQTMSRTLITSLTVVIVVWIMYIFGGEGLRGFNFCIGVGVIVGTYSSIAISAPALLLRKKANGESKS